MKQIVYLFFSVLAGFGQMKIENSTIPVRVDEGLPIEIKLSVSGSKDSVIQYSILQGSTPQMSLSKEGVFNWTPSFETVPRGESAKNVQIAFKAADQTGEYANKIITIKVFQKNQIPQAGVQLPFYVKFNEENTYSLDLEKAKDPDGDPILIIPDANSLPEGMLFNTNGLIKWQPSFAQFKAISNEPLKVYFDVVDQPAKEKNRGFVLLKATQLDLAPSFVITPDQTQVVLEENQPFNLNLHIADANGEDDISAVGFVADREGLASNLLEKKTPTHYTFKWQPNFEFLPDTQDSLKIKLTFFVIDKTQKRVEKNISVLVKNTENLAEYDQKRFDLYKGTMEQAWELREQLQDKEEKLKKALSKAKKGKKQRALTTAGFGATTGLSPVLTPKLENQRLISSIGGTTVVTISTLEATEVLGKSMKELTERLNYVIEKKNEIQIKGDIFARDYSLKSLRRKADFIKNLDHFHEAMNLKGLVALELDAGYVPKAKRTVENVQKVFRDYDGNN